MAGKTQGKRKYKVYYLVPSGSEKEVMHTVVRGGPGDIQCFCKGRRLGEGRYMCWHAELVSAFTAPWATGLVSGKMLGAARRGGLKAQFGVLAARLLWKVEGGSEMKAIHGACQVMEKYAQAIALQGEDNTAHRVSQEVGEHGLPR